MNKKVVIFSAPSGAGKSTVVGHCLSVFPQLAFSVSATSRKPRGGERDGVEYVFLDSDEFRRRIGRGLFVEWQEVYPGSFYGTLKSEVERIWAAGKVTVFDVDVYGGYNLKEQFGGKALSVFIQPPSLDVLRERLTLRATDSPEAIEMRLGKAREEMQFAEGKFDVTLVNDSLEQTFGEIDSVLSRFLEED